MASGPEHFKEAERLIELVEAGDSSDTMLAADELLTAAQVHATLALAAASAANIRNNSAVMNGETRFSAEWREALGNG